MNNREYNRWIKQGEEWARQNPTQYAINQKLAQAEGEAFLRSIPVSYTHLTLPTICSV